MSWGRGVFAFRGSRLWIDPSATGSGKESLRWHWWTWATLNWLFYQSPSCLRVFICTEPVQFTGYFLGEAYIKLCYSIPTWTRWFVDQCCVRLSGWGGGRCWGGEVQPSRYGDQQCLLLCIIISSRFCLNLIFQIDLTEDKGTLPETWSYFFSVLPRSLIMQVFFITSKKNLTQI